MFRISAAIAAFLVLSSSVAAQTSQVIGVVGTANAGLSFTMRLQTASITRDIHFVNLPVDYTALALAELMVERINEDYQANDSTGFEAKSAQKADKTSKYDATFVVQAAAPITNVLVGMYNMPTSPLPRAPGVGFNPNLVNFESNLPTPYVAPQLGAPDSDFLINGQDPDEEFSRVVEVPLHPTLGGPLSFSISSGSFPGAGIMLLHGNYNPGQTILPWGDSLDIGVPGPLVPGGISIVADGIFQASGNPLNPFFVTNAGVPAMFSLTVNAPANLAGTGAGDAFQAILFHPAYGGFSYRATQAAQPVFEFGDAGILPVAVDGFVSYAPVAGRAFQFYGTNYSILRLHENGVITFGPGTGTAASGVVMPGTAINGPPAIFVNWANWDMQPSGGIRYYQFGDELRVRWGTMNNPARHFGDTDAARFECVLGLNSNSPVINPQSGAIVFNYLSLDDAAMNANDALIGISSGNGFDANPFSLDFGDEQLSSNPMGSLLAQENRFGPSTATASLPLSGMSQQLYNNGTKWSGRELFIFPPVPSPFGFFHHAIANREHANDFVRVDPSTPSLSRSMVSQQLNLVGYFKYLFAGTFVPSVVLDPQGTFGPPRLLQIVGVMESAAPPVTPLPVPLQPGFRAFEGLRVAQVGPLGPSFPIGAQVAIQVNFSSGAIVVPNAVMIAP